MTGLQTITASTMSPASAPASAARSTASASSAMRTAPVISASPPGFIIA